MSSGVAVFQITLTDGIVAKVADEHYLSTGGSFKSHSTKIRDWLHCKTSRISNSINDRFGAKVSISMPTPNLNFLAKLKLFSRVLTSLICNFEKN